MANRTGISWAFATFNPWIGCTKISSGCKNCYAERDMDHRYKRAKWGEAGTRTLTTEAYWRKPLAWNKLAAEGKCICCGGSGAVRGQECWQCQGSGRIDGRPQTVFCASLADVFERYIGQMVDSNGSPLWFHRNDATWPVPMDGDVSQRMWDNGYRAMTMDDARLMLFDLIDATPNLTWLVLTKRIYEASIDLLYGFPMQNKERFFRGLKRSIGMSQFRGNMWVGTSIENQPAADQRIKALEYCRKFVDKLFLSVEPLLGPVDLTQWLNKSQCIQCDELYEDPDEDQDCPCGGDGMLARHPRSHIDWVIVGGESGPNARPMHPQWVRSLRDQCRAADVPFHFKQWGEWAEVEHQEINGVPVFRYDIPVLRLSVDGQSVTQEHQSDTDAILSRRGVRNTGRLLDGEVHDAIPAS